LVGEGGKLPRHPTVSIIGRFLISRKISLAGNTILDRMVSAAIKIIATSSRSYRKEVMGKQTTPTAASRTST